jgi:hypothetical protein
MNESLDDLIQRVLDGDGTAEDQRRLESRMASEASARHRYDELSRVFAGLKAVHLEEAPSGLRDEVLRSVREAALARTSATARAGVAVPATRRAARPAFSWLRLALPVAAGAVAAVVLFSTLGRTPWPGGDKIAGTMSAADGSALHLGSGGEAVHVTSTRTPGGFQLRIATGDAPVTVRIESAGGVLLALARSPEPRSTSLETPLPANTLTLVEGTAGPADSSVRVRVTLPGGRVVSGEVRVHGGASPR